MVKFKVWKERPSKSEVEDLVKEFFKHLQNGKLDIAKAMVNHAYPDWDESIYTVWQDHYLIHETPKDSSFEGGEWKMNLEWLKDLAIQDNIEWIKEDRLWVDFVFKGKPSGYIGEFAVKGDANGFFVERTIFRMA